MHHHGDHLQAPPSWMFKGNNTLNRAYGAGGDVDIDGSAVGHTRPRQGVKSQFQKFFLHKSFLLLKQRLSRTFSSFGRRNQVDDVNDGNEAGVVVRCSYCQKRRWWATKQIKSGLDSASGPGWAKREVLNDRSRHHFVEQVLLCPRHESACVQRMADVDGPTVLVKSRLWLELEDADRSRSRLEKIFGACWPSS